MNPTFYQENLSKKIVKVLYAVVQLYHLFWGIGAAACSPLHQAQVHMGLLFCVL